MNPATVKVTAQLLLTLARSKFLRRVVIAVGLVWAVLIATIMLVPLYVGSSVGSRLQMVSAAACAGTPGFPVPVSLVGSSGGGVAVRIATWNTRRDNSTGQILSGLRGIAAEGADVIGVQELTPESRRRTVRAAMTRMGWGMSTGNNAVPIFYRRARYELLAQDSVKVFGVERIEPGVAGTAIGPKLIQWVQLRNRRSGAAFFAANHHLVPAIDKRGRPDPRSPKRLRLARLQLSAAAALADGLGRAGPVLITADWNIDARADARVKDRIWPYVALGQHGLASNWRVLGHPRGRGTHGGGSRLIDYVMSRGVRPVQQRILTRSGSDHAAVLVTASTRAGNSSAALTTTPNPTPDRLVVPGSEPGGSLTLTGEQVSNAAVIIAEGRRHKIPQYGWVVALAAALQESGIRNLSHGDRDSEGMFQQRPGAAWGTPGQIRDPRLATRAFFGVASHTDNRGLVDIAGWQQMTVTEAAQAVQGSGFPTAYAKWEPAARSIVQQLSDGVTAGPNSEPLVCGTDTDAAMGGNCSPSGSPAEQGLTRDALLALRCVRGQFPQITTFGGVRADSLPDHPSGRAVDFMIDNYQTAAGNAYGWQVARWLKDHRVELGVSYVIFDAKIWTVARDREGWRDYQPGYTSQVNDSSMHRNHVHVTVFGDQGTGFRDQPVMPPGAWTMPLPAGSYRVGCAYGCYSGHGGQDFPAPSGTRVLATTTGVVTRSAALRDRNGTYVSYGNLIVIKSAGDMEFYHAHLQRRIAKPGDQVQAGQLIGYTGHTGNVRPAGEAGAHLHYEIRVDGQPVNPMPILRQKGLTWDAEP
jgi:hypothetical protein